VRRLFSGQTIFFGPKTEQSLVHLIFIRLPHVQRDYLNFCCMAAELQPLPDQQPAALALVQVKLLDGYSLSPLAIRRFDRAEVFAAAADDEDAPASESCGLLRIGTPGHGGKIIGAETECEAGRACCDHVARSGRQAFATIENARKYLATCVARVAERNTD